MWRIGVFKKPIYRPTQLAQPDPDYFEWILMFGGSWWIAIFKHDTCESGSRFNKQKKKPYEIQTNPIFCFCE